MKFAAESVDITPEGSVPMSGYARAHDSVGVLERLQLHAAVLDDGDARLAIVRYDLVGIDRPFHRDLSAAIRRVDGLENAALLANASHTHSGPVFLRSDTHDTVPPDDYRRFVLQSSVEALQRCVRTLEPGRLAAGTGKTHIGICRREIRDGTYKIGRNLSETFDNDLNVLRLDDGEGIVRIVIFQCACHPVTHRRDNYRLSPDFLGSAYREIRSAFPHAIPVFLQGAAGTINPVMRGADEDYAKESPQFIATEYVGRILANDVINICRQELELPDVRFRFGAGEAVLDFQGYEREYFQSLIDGESEERRAYARRVISRYETGAFSEGRPLGISIYELSRDVRIVALEGEICDGVGIGIKRLFEDGTTLVLGYSNGYINYIPTRKIIEEGGYEGTRAYINGGFPARFTLDTEDRIYTKVRDLLSQLPGSPAGA